MYSKYMAKILLTDDDSLMVRMYQTKFSKDGFEVQTAGNGEDCLKKLNTYTPDVVLLDVMMPVKNGLDTLKEIKANSKTKNIPVVLLTNMGGGEEDVEKGLELGAVAYLVKASYTPAEVVKKVKEILAGYKKDVPEVKVAIKKE